MIVVEVLTCDPLKCKMDYPILNVSMFVKAEFVPFCAL